MGYSDKKRYIVLQDEGTQDAKLVTVSAYTQPADGTSSVARYSFGESDRFPAVSTEPGSTSIPAVSASGKVDNQNTESPTSGSNMPDMSAFQTNIVGDGFVVGDGPAGSAYYSYVRKPGTQAQFRATNNGFQKFSYGRENKISTLGAPCYVRPSMVPLKNGNLLASHIESNSPPWMWTFLSTLRTNTNVQTETFDNTPLGRIRISLLDSESRTWSCPNANVAQYGGYPEYELSVFGSNILDSMDYLTQSERGKVSITSANLVQFDDTEEVLCIYTGFFGQNVTNQGTTFLPSFLCVDVINEDFSSQAKFCRSEYASLNPSGGAGGVWGVGKSSRSVIRINSNPARTSASIVSSDVPGLISHYRPLDSTAQVLPDGRLVVVILFEDSLWSLVSTDRGKSFEATLIKRLVGLNDQGEPDGIVQRFGSVSSCLSESGEVVIVASSPAAGLDEEGWPRSYTITDNSGDKALPCGMLSIFASSNGVNWGREKNLNKTLNATKWSEFHTITSSDMPNGGDPVYPFLGFNSPYKSYKDNALYCVDASVCRTAGGEILVTAATLNLGGPGNAQSQQIFQRVLSVKEILSGATEDDIAKQMPESFDSVVASAYTQTQRLQRAYPYKPNYSSNLGNDDITLDYFEWFDFNVDYKPFGYFGHAYWGGIHSFISSDEDYNRMRPPLRIPNPCYLDLGGGPYKSFGPIGVATCLWRDTVVTTTCEFFEDSPLDYPGFAERCIYESEQTGQPLQNLGLDANTFTYFATDFYLSGTRTSTVKTLFSGGLQPGVVRLPTELRYFSPTFSLATDPNAVHFEYLGEPYNANLLETGNLQFQLGSNSWQVAWDSGLLPDETGWYKTESTTATGGGIVYTSNVYDNGGAIYGGSDSSKGTLGGVLKINTKYLSGQATGTIDGTVATIRSVSSDPTLIKITTNGLDFLAVGDFLVLNGVNHKVFSLTTSGLDQDIVINDVFASATRVNGNEILVPKNSGFQTGDTLSFIHVSFGTVINVTNISVTSHSSTQDKITDPNSNNKFWTMSNPGDVYKEVAPVNGITFGSLVGNTSVGQGVFEYLAGDTFETADDGDSQQVSVGDFVRLGIYDLEVTQKQVVTGVVTFTLDLGPTVTTGITGLTNLTSGSSWAKVSGGHGQDYVYYDYANPSDKLDLYPNSRGRILKYRVGTNIKNPGYINISPTIAVGENRSFLYKDLSSQSFVCRMVICVDKGGGLNMSAGYPVFSDLGMGADILLMREYEDGTNNFVGKKVHLQLRCGRESDPTTDKVAFQVYDVLGDVGLVNAVFDEDAQSRDDFQRPFYEVIFSLSFPNAQYADIDEYPSVTRILARPWDQYSDPDMLNDFAVRETDSSPVFQDIEEGDLEIIRWGHFNVGNFDSWPASQSDRESCSYWGSFSFSRGFLRNSHGYVNAFSHPDGTRRGTKKIGEGFPVLDLPLFPVDNNALFVEPDPLASSAPLSYMREINGGVFSPTMPPIASVNPSFVDSGISLGFVGLLNSSDRFQYFADSSFRAENIFSVPAASGWRSSTQTVPYDSGVYPHVSPNNIVYPVPSYYMMFEFEEGILPEAVSFFGINTDEVKVDFYRNKNVNMSYHTDFGFFSNPSLSLWMSPPGSPSGRLYTEWSNISKTPRPFTDIAWRPNYLFYWDGPGNSSNDGWQASIGDPLGNTPKQDYFVYLYDEKAAASSSTNIQRTAPFIPGKFKSVEGESYYLVCYDEAVLDATFNELYTNQGFREYEGHRYIFKIEDNGVDWVKLTSPIGETHSFSEHGAGGTLNTRVQIKRFAIISDRVGSNFPDYWPLVARDDPDTKSAIQDFNYKNTYNYMMVRLSGGIFYDPEEKFLKLGMMICGKKVELGSRHLKWDWSYGLEFGNSLKTGLTGQRRRRRNHRPRREWSVSYEPMRSPPVLTSEIESDAATQYYNEVRGFGSVRGRFGPNSEQDSDFSKLSWVEVVQRVLNVEVNGQVFALAFEGFQMMSHNSIHFSSTSAFGSSETTYYNAKYVPALSDPGSFCPVRLVGYGGAQNEAYSSRSELAAQDMDKPWQNETGFTANYSLAHLKEGKRYLTSRPMPVVRIQSLKFSEEL